MPQPKELSRSEAVCLNFEEELMRCFPALPEKVRTYLNIFLPRLLVTTQENFMSLDLVGSVQRRVVEGLDEEGVLFPGSKRIIAVQDRFKELYNKAQASSGEEPLLAEYLTSIKKLASGVDDLDFKVRKEGDEQLTKEDKLRFGKIFLETAEQINREDFKMEASFGPISTNPSRGGGQLLFRQNGQDVFVVHIGFFPGSQSRQYDRRAGGERVPKKQQGAIPLELEGGRLTLVIVDPHAEVRRLADPDDFAGQELPKAGWDLDGDLEIMLRTIRVALFHHNEKLLEKASNIDNVCNILFSPNLWQWMENVVECATESFSQNSPSVQLQRRLAEMMMLRLEVDPYLTLLIAERIGLLKLFPYFSDKLPSLTQKDMRWILEQRERFLRSGDSGLGVFVGEKTRITPQEFVELINFFKIS